MEPSKALQQQLTDQPVTFLYYAVNCSESSWERTIKKYELTGEHYRSNDREYAYLAERFGISGIPHYALIDQEGRVVNDNAPRPSQPEELLSLIDGLLRVEGTK